MTETAALSKTRRVFRRWPFIAFVALVPFALHAGWDYLEARSLKTALDALRAAGAPVAETDLQPRVQVEPPEKDAAPYYTAAAVLAGDRWPSTGGQTFNVVVTGGRQRRLFQRLARELEAGVVSDELLGEMRGVLEQRDEALRLLDRATELEFRRFAPGTDYGYRAYQLIELKSLCSLRTSYLALTGDGNGAAASVNASIRLGRVIAWGPFRIQAGSFVSVRNSAADLQLVLERTEPSEPRLAAIAEQLAAADSDATLTRYFMDDRASLIDAFVSRALGANYFESGGSGLFGARSFTHGDWLDALVRPFTAHRLRRQLATYDALVDASRKPWPQRIDALRAVPLPARPHFPFPYNGFFNYATDWAVNVIVTDTAYFRSARVAVAIERHRREHAGQLPDGLTDLVPSFLDAPPIDPFSGQPIQYRRLDGGYVVYSVGRDGKDDGGAVRVIQSPAGSEPPKDMGIRVTGRKR